MATFTEAVRTEYVKLGQEILSVALDIGESFAESISEATGLGLAAITLIEDGATSIYADHVKLGDVLPGGNAESG